MFSVMEGEVKAPFSSLPYLDGASFLIPNLFCKYFILKIGKLLSKIIMKSALYLLVPFLSMDNTWTCSPMKKENPY